MSVEEQLRKAIIDARKLGVTHYALWKKTNVAASIIDRFVAGNADIRISNVSRLCDALGMQLTPPKLGDKQDANKQPATPGKRRPGSNRAKRPARKQG